MTGKFNLNNLLNSKSKGTIIETEVAEEESDNEFKIELISVYDLEPSENNFYSVNDIADLKDSIEILGVQQNLVVKKIPNTDRYRVIAGHRRRLASMKLTEEGKKQFELVPCRVEEIDDITEQIMLIYTNCTTRQLSSWEKIEQLARLKVLFHEYKKMHDLPGRVREILAEVLDVSESQVSRMESINENLTEEFKTELKESRINFSTAAELSRLPAADQKAVYEQHQQTGETKLKDVKKVKHPKDELFIDSSQATISAIKKIKSLLEGQLNIANLSRMQEIKIKEFEKTETTERIRILTLLMKTVDNQAFEIMGGNIFEG